MKLPAAALAPALLLAGCLAAEVAPLPPEAEPAVRTLFLQPDGTLREEVPAETAVPLRWGWRQWLDGVEAPAWTTEPLDVPMLVTAAHAHVLHGANAPVTTLGTRPELTVWFGAGTAVSDHGFQAGPPAMLPGDRVGVSYELLLPVGGLYVPAGEPLVLRVGSYYDDDEARGAVEVLVGADPLSRLEIQALTLPAPSTPTATHTDGTSVALTGGRCLGLDPATDNDLAWLDVAADPAKGRLVGIDIDVAHAGGEGPPDVDFVLLDADGEVVGHAAGSAGIERLVLREPNLAAAAPVEGWRLGVYACTPQRSTADVQVAMHYA